jgi:hypothetical protein
MVGMLTTKRIRYKSIIASVSFGAERTFQLKHNTIKDLKKKHCTATVTINERYYTAFLETPNTKTPKPIGHKMWYFSGNQIINLIKVLNLK